MSTDNGSHWSAFVVNMTAPGGEITSRIPHDYQGISTSFAGEGVAFPSDQGLFVTPRGLPGSPGATVSLINANGDMSNNIAIKVSVAAGNGTHRYLVTSMWDWGPLASWDGGRSWPVGDWNPNAATKPADSEVANAGVVVQLETEHSSVCGHNFNNNFWLPQLDRQNRFDRFATPTQRKRAESG